MVTRGRRGGTHATPDPGGGGVTSDSVILGYVLSTGGLGCDSYVHNGGCEGVPERR